ncbi:DUF6371 domain-containing protein [Aliifodinibius sp. S!AR15-10]|uniref:DUF6371 domain-containing protein n=1 Tax=Aliifodinibius sp. S!AR15-10 TaxID=2950437 RepID=UPI0028670515|nr:DUF6371 domain-containing protein [Aliifodinibius sp. S!AR15-10]MDR8394074.1 DUF6371 domain-containing protein [Aliifodinibius sp. S!AR15-10]
MKSYRYRLDDSSRKFECPQCRKKRFVRYKDYQAGTYLPEEFGRCDRESSCGYFKDPYNHGYANRETSFSRSDHNFQEIPKPTDYISQKYFRASLKGYKRNKFVQFLRSLFDIDTVRNLIDTYNIGTSRHWEGATVFWQIDIQGNIRTGKVMLYKSNGHRVKVPYPHIHWVHSLVYDSYHLEQCLFGEHLLTGDKTVPIAIVESEKTAIISSAYFPEFIWLAAGAKSNLKSQRCKSLMGRSVTLFPDLGAFEDWQEKAEGLSYFCDITVSDLLEKNATRRDKEQGYDLADYLVQYGVREFINGGEPAPTKFDVELNDKGYPASWDTET